MIFFLRLLPVIGAVWLLVFFRLALGSPTMFWYYAGTAVLGTLASLWLLIRHAKLPQGRWSILAFPTLTLIAVVGVLLFSERAALQGVLLVGLASLFALYTEQLFRFTHAPARYQPNALVNLGYVFAVLSIFFVSLTVFDLQLFANVPLWLAVSIFVVIATLWCVMVFRFVDAPSAYRWPWGLTLGIVMVEVFALMAWLPVLPFVKAATLALIVTVVLQRVRDDVSGAAKPKRWTTVVLLAMLLFVLVTARWFA
ncbi:MAG: hypothetical protein Q8O51_00340 [bacterium]|nr:hypothetical protein [bacterium]